MKSWNAKLMALAATLAMAAAHASAQTVLKASVPFSFRTTAGATMEPGNYLIYHDGARWTFSNVDARQQTIAEATVSVEPKRNDQPSLVFQCRANRCTLSQVVTGRGEMGAYWAPNRSKSDREELAQIVVVPATLIAR
jgi:hypothetical protein